MVTVRLIGGLGNQLFQYAMGRSIAHRRRTSLALDIHEFPDIRQRQYSLGPFKIIEKLTRGGLLRIGGLRGLCHRVRIPGLPFVLVEPPDQLFHPSALEAPGNVYMVGYWQSEKYFQEIEEIIRGEFCFKREPEGQNAEIAAKIRGVNAVCVHVRRTDNVTVPGAARLYGTCSLEYYRDAAGLIVSRVASPQFFVFSDEPDWAEANLKLEGPATFVSHNGMKKGYEDLRLMSYCRHHIIANSTLSWWGAWLGNSGGIVVAPRKWYNTSDYDSRDLVPERWVRI